MGNTSSSAAALEASLDENLPARLTRWESSYIGPNLSSLIQAQSAIVPPPLLLQRTIYHTAWLLRQLTLPELVPTILHYADIFETQTFEVEDVTTTHQTTSMAGFGWPGVKHAKKYDCLVSRPIRSAARIKCPVRKVVFEIESRETVWERRDGSCCWTRFTAGVLPPDEPEAEGEGEDEGDGEAEAIAGDEGEAETAVGDEGAGVGTGVEEEQDLLNEREIGRHDSALREVKTYRLQWTVDSDDPEEREWVQSLANGDRLVVRASALYPGFVNKIHTVRVGLYMGAVV